MRKTAFSEGVKHNWAKILALVLGVMFIGAAAFAAVKTRELSAANVRMSAVVQKAFYETCELTEAMSVNFAKLPVAGEP